MSGRSYNSSHPSPPTHPHTHLPYLTIMDLITEYDFVFCRLVRSAMDGSDTHSSVELKNNDTAGLQRWYHSLCASAHTLTSIDINAKYVSHPSHDHDEEELCIQLDTYLTSFLVARRNAIQRMTPLRITLHIATPEDFPFGKPTTGGRAYVDVPFLDNTKFPGVEFVVRMG